MINEEEDTSSADSRTDMTMKLVYANNRALLCGFWASRSAICCARCQREVGPERERTSSQIFELRSSSLFIVR